MKEHTISIIVPVYNTEDYLGECIRSIAAQTYPNLEIIIIDDGSTDKSKDIIKEWAQRDKRIVSIYKEKNTGVSNSRNIGINCSNGSYIGFVDSDDFIHPQMYEVLLKQIEETGADVAVCGIETVSEWIDTWSNYDRVSSNSLTSKDALSTCIPRIPQPMNAYTVNKLYNMKLIKNEHGTTLFNEKNSYCEDTLWLSEIISKANLVSFCESSLYFYRASRNGNTATSMWGNTKKTTKYTKSAISAYQTVSKKLRTTSREASINALQRSLAHRITGMYTALQCRDIAIYDYCSRNFLPDLWHWLLQDRSIVGFCWFLKKCFEYLLLTYRKRRNL